MRMSLRGFLLINVLLIELFTILLAIAIILVWGYRDAQQAMDSHLLKTAFAVQSFVGQPQMLADLSEIQKGLHANGIIATPDTYEGYSEDKITHFRVANMEGKKILDSEDDIPDYLLDTPIGFSDLRFNNSFWRAFTTIDPTNKFKIILLQKQDRYNLLRGPGHSHIVRVIILAMLLSYAMLGFLLWLILNRGLKALKSISHQIQQQGLDNFSYIECPTKLPLEIKTIVDEWNKLFDRLKIAFEREKNFAADAAHELKTPLAALKTHTQIAMHAKNEQELVNSLQKIISGVNRSAHVVQQLLILNKINQGVIVEQLTPVDLVKQITEVISDLSPQASEKHIEVAFSPNINPIIDGHDTAISILIRNLIDNAIRYSPEYSVVQIVLEQSLDKENLSLIVTDSGPGIPENLHDRVFERFFRVIGNENISGSGLGLGIVRQIVESHHASIQLKTPPTGKGLQVIIIFKKFVQDMGENAQIEPEKENKPIENTKDNRPLA